MDIPIIIISYNNYKYVENTLNMIKNINISYYNNIKILDNCSKCNNTRNFLKKCDVPVIYNNINTGPWISSNNNSELYNSLPDKFIITDPDLDFNKNLPNNFIDILSKLSDKYMCNKIGFALDINDYYNMYQYNNYFDNHNIYDWEKQFWIHKIYDENYELYNAGVDTTFCLINKNYNNINIRIAGNFTAKHLPWYINNKIYNVYENYITYKQQTNISTISKIIIYYIENNYLKINKNNEVFFIKNNEVNPNFNFWKYVYTNWKKDTFDIFDKYLCKNKIFIDIGGWNGTTSMYGSRKSKHVYVIEADKQSVIDMKNNLEINCENNYTLINKAIYNIDDITVKLGKKLFMNQSKMNDSTSQIYDDNDISDEYYSIDTITLVKLIENNKINFGEISLIKVDIEGGEEFILNDLYNIYFTYNIPIYISFHYAWWKNKNLDRFDFLTNTNKEYINLNPFTSVIFNHEYFNNCN